MAFTIYLRNTTQKVYSMQAALKIASLHIAQHIPVERIEAPDGKTLDAEAIRRMCQSP
jgi:hypothetical protein